ncbi:MAG: electron transfer flavoprotein alpha subunit [Flavobacteriales bacterium]|jgi:electron transfer flavoprotein alpha subunit
MSILVLAETESGKLKESTRNVVNAASQLTGDVHVLVAGSSCSDAANSCASIDGVDKVLLVDSAEYEHLVAENYSDLVVSLAVTYDYILCAANTTGKNTLPRIGALLDSQPLSDITSIESDDTFIRPIYAGNVFAKVKLLEDKKLLSIRGSAFDAAGDKDTKADIETVASNGASENSRFVSEELAKSDRPELTAASIVISGGRGLENGENFQLLYSLADKLGAAVGASRAAVDAGFVPNDLQVGQTGKIVAPDLYIAVGISGAIQHLAGMKESKVIVAINKDENAEIFEVADYGLVADLFDAVPELDKALS